MASDLTVPVAPCVHNTQASKRTIDCRTWMKSSHLKNERDIVKAHRWFLSQPIVGHAIRLKCSNVLKIIKFVRSQSFDESIGQTHWFTGQKNSWTKFSHIKLLHLTTNDEPQQQHQQLTFQFHFQFSVQSLCHPLFIPNAKGTRLRCFSFLHFVPFHFGLVSFENFSEQILHFFLLSFCEWWVRYSWSM